MTAPRPCPAAVCQARLRLAGWWLLLLIAAGSPAGEPPGDPPPLQFRRIQVDQQSMPDLKLDGLHVPVNRENFERMVRSTGSAGGPPGGVLASRIAQASYTARLEGDRLVNGEAELHIVHRAEGPAAVSLEPCRLVVEQSTWTAEAGASDAAPGSPAAEAQVGYSDSGQFTLLAPTSGRLNLRWTLRGQRDSTGHVQFALQLPASPLTQLLLDVPRGLQPVVTQGFASLAETGVDGQEWNRWLLELSAQQSVLLRIVPQEAQQKSPRRVLLRQQTSYDFAPQGVELQADFRLDVFDEPLSQLPLRASPGLRLIEAQLDGQPLRWTDAAQDSGRQLVLEMPEAVLGVDRLVRVKAVAALTMGRPWQLPVLGVAEATWLQGSATLTLPQSLVLEQLFTAGCRATSTARKEGGGETVQIQCFEPVAEITTVLQPRQGELLTRTGTSFNLGRSRTSAIQVTDLTTTGPPRFELALEASTSWNIDLIETQPAGLLEEWTLTGRTNQHRLIQLRLREPLAAGQPLRVQIQAHGRGLRGGHQLGGGLLRLGEFTNSTTAQRLVSLATDSPNQIRLQGDSQLVRLAAGDLNEQDQRLITATPGAVLYADGPGANELVVDLSSDPPNYSARIDLDVDVSERKLDLTYRIEVQPESASVDRILVHFSQPSEAPLHWSWDAAAEGELLARRQAAENASAAPRGETWQITLPGQQNAPFELAGRRTLELKGGVSVPLASLPGPATQLGNITIRAEEPLPLQIEPQNLRPVAAETLPPTAYGSTRAVFRYDPLQDVQLRIQATAGSGPEDLAWIWSCDLESRHYSDGKTLHQAVYCIENRGATQLTLHVPEPVEWLTARVDERELPVSHDSAGAGELKIALPRGVRFPTLRVQYVAPGVPLRSTGTATVVWPQVRQQVFRRTWTAWLPPGVAPQPDSTARELDSWQQRWFGALLRSPEQPRFAPLAPNTWLIPAAPVASQAPPALRQQAWRQLARLGARWMTLSEAATADSPLTWGELLSAWQEPEAGTATRPDQVWVDQRAIGVLGITSRSPVPSPLPDPGAAEEADPAFADAAALGSTVLGSAGLALLVHADLVLVTSLEALITDQQALVATGLRNVRGVTNASWAEAVVEAASDLQRVPLYAWAGEPPLPQICWRQPAPATHEFLREGGWTVHRIPIAAAAASGPGLASRNSFAVYQPLVFQAYGWATLLTAAGLALWIVGWQFWLGLPLIAAAAAAALVVPPLLLPIAQDLLWGVLLGSLLVWLRAAASRGVARDRPRDDSRVSTVSAASAIMTLLALAWASTARGQADAGTAPAPPVYQVLSPIDANAQPAGDYVFVPKDFYDALLQRGSGPPANAQKWLIRDAAYRAVMNWKVAEEQLSVLELTATYELEVFPPAVRLLLPMAAEQVHLLPSRALLNGRPASVNWAGEGSGLEVEIDSPGVHRLELAFRPQVRRGEDYDSFQVAIPRAAGSRLNVELPAKLAQLEFPTALGSVQADLRTGSTVVQLGPTQLLSVRWPAGTSSDSTPAALELNQLVWLQIQPDRVTVDTKLRFANLSMAVASAELRVDPRLRLLPPRSDQPITWYESAEGSTQTIYLEFKPPHQQEVEVLLSFVMQDTVGIGRLALPRIEAQVDRINRHWLGVSLDPSLEGEFLPQPTGNQPTAADFAAAWANAESSPQMVLDLASRSGSSLAVRPLEFRGTAEHHLEISCGLESADLIYTADVRRQQGQCMQYEIDLPPCAYRAEVAAGEPQPLPAAALTITSVAVEEAGQPRLLSWSRNAGRELVLRLSEPIAQDQRIRVEARLKLPQPVGSGAVLSVPGWEIAGVQTASRRVDVYRDSLAQVAEVAGSGLIPAPDFQAGRYRPQRGRWAAALQSASAAADGALRLVLAPNRPQTTGNMAIRVQRETDSWSVAADCRLQVAKGVLDAVRFEIPADWKGPFQITPEAEVSLAEVPGQSRRQLIVRPLQAVAGEFHLQLRAPLTASPRERMRVPDLVPLDVDQVRGYVVLPSRIDQQSIEWERKHLQVEALPEEFAALAGPGEVSYRTVQPRFQAVIKDIQVESGVAYVRLADYYLDVDAGGRIWGVATYDLEPGGKGARELLLPQGTQALRVSVAELPLTGISADQRQVPLPAGPRQLAQRIEVLFVSQRDFEHEPCDLAEIVPGLAGLPVEKTCWTIRRPADAGLQVLAADIADPATQDALRVRSLARLIAKAEEVLQDGDPEQIARWYVPWARRWSAVRSRLGLRQEVSGGFSDKENLLLKAIDENQRQIAERLGVLPQMRSVEQQAWLASETADVWRIADSPQRLSTTHVIAADGSASPRLLRSATPAAAAGRSGDVVALLLGSLLIGLLFLPPAPLDCWRWHPQLLLAIVGAAWWQFLAAGGLGFLLMSLSLLALLIRGVRRRWREAAAVRA